MRDSSLLTDLISLSEQPVDGAVLAHILTRLAACELDEGGPYGHTGSADLELNLAVAIFLDTHGVRLPNVDSFITKHLASDEAHPKNLDTLIARYRAGVVTKPAAAHMYDAHEQSVLDAVLARARERLAGLPTPFAESALAVIERTMRGNPDKQMTLMPLYMRDALGEKGKHFTNERLAELGLANVCFWTAFIIYDDFWDEDEAAEPKLLPVANLFARQYVQFFENLLPPEFFHDMMDRLDAANAWEMTDCRLARKDGLIVVPDTLPDYGDFLIKFYPAAGHVFGPVAMLMELGHGTDSAEMAHLIDYFRYYLVAMQLNDDAHDWKEDLERGHISTAVSLLLSAWKRVHPEKHTIDPVRDMPELERLFWFETLVPLCEAALSCTHQSRAALNALTCVEYPKPLEQFITLNERIAQSALDEQKKSIAFLEALHSIPT